MPTPLFPTTTPTANTATRTRPSAAFVAALLLFTAVLPLAPFPGADAAHPIAPSCAVGSPGLDKAAWLWHDDGSPSGTLADYASIQAAIDCAQPGDKVLVLTPASTTDQYHTRGGIHPENLVVNNAGITICAFWDNFANWGKCRPNPTALQRPVLDPQGATGTVIRVNAADVTIHGLLIRNTGLNGAGYGIDVRAANVVIENNVVQGNFDASDAVPSSPTHNQIGIGANAGSSGVEILGNDIRNWKNIGLHIAPSGGAGGLIQDNLVHENRWHGILLEGPGTGLLTVEGNTVREHGFSGLRIGHANAPNWEIRHNTFALTNQYALTIQNHLTNIPIDMRYNDWGRYSKSEIESSSIEYGTGSGNTVDISCFVDSDGLAFVCPPTAAFTMTPAPAIWKTSVSFADASTPGARSITTRVWDLGDGATSTATNPTHSYAASGTYPVTLTVTDSEGFSSTFTQNLVVDNNAPTFTHLPPIVTFTVGSIATFFARAEDPDGDSITYSLISAPAGSSLSKLANGSARFTWSVGHLHIGTHLVTIGATDGEHSISGVVTVEVLSANAPPVPRFTNPVMLKPGEVGTFTSTSYDPDGILVSEEWSFSDGYTASGSIVTRSFTTEGPHLVTLTVMDDESATRSLSRYVLVDGTAPVSTHTTDPAPTNGWHRSAFTVSLSAMDALSGVHAIHYRVNGGPLQTYWSATKPVISGEGIHSITYYAVDRLGNPEAAKTIPFAIDSTPPLLQLQGSSTRVVTYGTETFTAEVTDTESGVARVEFILNGVVQKTLNAPGPYIWDWTLAGESLGRHDIVVRAHDRAGNVAEQTVTAYRFGF